LSKLTYGVIDSGNIGIYLAACASKYNLDVHMYSGDTAISELTVVSPLGDFTENSVKSYDSPLELPCCDVLFLNVNTLFELQLSPSTLKEVISPKGILVLFQKGVNEYPEFSLHPELIVLGGLVWLKPSKVGDDTVKHDFGSLIELGSYYHQQIQNEKILSDAAALVINSFSGSRIDFSFTADFSVKSWTRLALNLPYFMLSTLGNKYSQEVFSGDSRDDAFKIRGEVAQLAKKESVEINHIFIREMDKKLLCSPPSYPGLKQDFDSGSELCLNDIFGRLLDLATDGISVPAITSCYDRLIEMENRRRRTKSSES
jgi:ketopantoate reductase